MIDSGSLHEVEEHEPDHDRDAILRPGPKGFMA